MRAPRASSVAAALGLAIAATTAQGMPFRCGTEIVSMGDTKYQVAEKCGEPDFVEIDKWIYDERPAGMINIVHFVNDEVSRIEQEPLP